LRPESVLRFRREASAAARLAHPGIAQAFAVGEAEGLHFFAMELIEGAPLDRVLERLASSTSKLHGRDVARAVEELAIRREGAAPVAATEALSGRSYVEVACRLVLQVAEALAHAHRTGILHRDVKPSNVLVRPDGTAVLTDFGLARDLAGPSHTQTGAFAGTPYYLAPEQLHGPAEAIDARVDVYALGVTLYELVTLRRPFEGDTAAAILARIASDEPPRPTRLRAGVPRDLETIVLKAIEKDLARRYASADAFADDLRAFLEFRPIQAKPPSLVARAGKLARRNRTASAAAAIAAAALGIGAIAWWAQPGTLEIASTPEGAMVVLDGETRPERTPAQLRLSPGLHTIRLEKREAGLVSDVRQVVVSRGAKTVVEPLLASTSGVVAFRSTPPGARIELEREGDGGRVVIEGRTPCFQDVLAGRYRAHFRLEGFAPRAVDLVVPPAGRREDCAVAWPTGSLALDAEQPGMSVAVYSGAEIGDAPLRTITLPAEPLVLPTGTYSLRAELQGHLAREWSGDRAVKVAEERGAGRRLWLSPARQRRIRPLQSAVAVLAAGDLDGDGVPEIVAGGLEGRIVALGFDDDALWKLDTRGEPQVIAVRSDGADGVGAALAAANRAGLAWIVSATGEARSVAPEGGAGVQTLAWGDVDGDGATDLVLGTKDGEVHAVRADGDAIWRTQVEPGRNVAALRLADLDGDGRLEIAAGPWASPVAILDSGGAVRARFAQPGKALAFADARFDGDGRRDLVVGTDATGLHVTAFRFDGTSRFTSAAHDWIEVLETADLDGDGRDEVLAGDHLGRVLALDASGARLWDARVHSKTVGLHVADLDGDGAKEVAASAIAGHVLVVDARGRSRLEVALPHAASSAEMDLDGDGTPEILLGTESGEIAVFGIDPRLVLETRTSEGAVALGAIEARPSEPGALVVLTREARCFSVDGEGAIRWRRPFGEVSAIAESKDGVLVFDASGSLEAVRGADGPPIPVLAAPGKWVEFAALAAGEADGRPAVAVADAGGRTRLLAPEVRPGPALRGATIGLVAVTDAAGASLFVRAGVRQLDAFRPDGTLAWSAETRGAVSAIEAGSGAAEGADLLLGFDSGAVAPYSIATRRQGAAIARVPGRVASIARSHAGERVVAIGTAEGECFVVGEDGRVRLRRRAGQGPVRVSLVDLDGDGVLEVVAAASNETTIFGWSLATPDARASARRELVAGLDAADRGETEDASARLARARLRWRSLDDGGSVEILERLRRTSGVADAARLADRLERRAPPLRAWLDRVEDLLDAGRTADAQATLGACRERLAAAPQLAADMNQVAWDFVKPEAARPETAAVVHTLAEAAVAASGRNDPAILDTLAEAHFLEGRFAEAVAIEREAIAKLPGTRDADRRALFESSLVRFEAAARAARAER
ncbi:MAG TPA: FG-GAP-like repeat-containing protein, partial [Planctomycetota bacterium]|nr:FG-GAP-like repeat-containing protein [Planctomycetota bacterium]